MRGTKASKFNPIGLHSHLVILNFLILKLARLTLSPELMLRRIPSIEMIP